MRDLTHSEGTGAFMIKTGRNCHGRDSLWLPSTMGGQFVEDLHLSLKEGKGLWATDDKGISYLDANSGLWHLSLGYGPSPVANAVYEAAYRIGGCSLFRRTHDWANSLASEITGKVKLKSDGRVLFTTSGSEAADTAMRIALAYHDQLDRRYFAYVRGAYHGVSIGPLSLMGIEGYHNGLPPAIPAIELPSYRTWEEDEESTRSYLRELFKLRGHQIAAVFIEPIQGSGGVLRIPDSYAAELQRLIFESKTLLVVDEVACGTGRAGKLAYYVSYEVLAPDMVLLGKGLTAGISALSAVIVEDPVMAAVIGTPHLNRLPGTTHSGNPVSCAAAITTLRILEGSDQTELQSAASTWLDRSLQSMLSFETVKAVRGWGHMWGVEVEAIPVIGNRTWVDTVTTAALRHQLLIHPLSIGVIPIFPALIASTAEVSEIAKRLAAAFLELGSD